MAWAKLHTDILGDPKLMRAARKGAKGLQLLPWFIAFAKEADDGGRLTVGGEPADAVDIAALIPNTTAKAVSESLSSLKRIGVLVADEDGALRLAAWERRSGVAERKLGPAKLDAAGYVYYARCGDQVKIGVSQNPWSRVSELRTARPDTVLVGVEPGDRHLERKRQQELGGRTDFRNNGRGSEWFPWTDAVAEFVAGLADSVVDDTTPPTTKTRSSDTTENSSSLLEEKRGEESKKRREKRPATVVDTPALPKPVCDALYEVWVSEIGAVEYPRFRKALLPLYPTSGPRYTQDQLANAIKAFSESRLNTTPDKRSFWNPEKFAGDVVEQVRIGAMKCVDDDGIPTERGRIVMSAP